MVFGYSATKFAVRSMTQTTGTHASPSFLVFYELTVISQPGPLGNTTLLATLTLPVQWSLTWVCERTLRSLGGAIDYYNDRLCAR